MTGAVSRREIGSAKTGELNLSALCSLKRAERIRWMAQEEIIRSGHLLFFALNTREKVAAIGASAPSLDRLDADIVYGSERVVGLPCAMCADQGEDEFVGEAGTRTAGRRFLFVVVGAGTIRNRSQETARRHGRFYVRVTVAVLLIHSGGLAKAAVGIAILDVLGRWGDVDVPSRIRANITTSGHDVANPASALVPMARLDPNALPLRKRELPFDPAPISVVLLRPELEREGRFICQLLAFVARNKLGASAAIFLLRPSIKARDCGALSIASRPRNTSGKSAISAADADAREDLAHPLSRYAEPNADGSKRLPLQIEGAHFQLASHIAYRATRHLSGPRVFAVGAVENDDNRQFENISEHWRELRANENASTLDARHVVLRLANRIRDGLLRQSACLACSA